MKTTKKELIEKAKAFINDAILLLNTAICKDSKACNLKITISSKDKCLVLDDSLDELIEYYKDNDEGMDIYDKYINTLINTKGHQE